MLKRTLQKIILEQKGQTLPIVLVLMLLGGLLIVPTLNYASSTLRINQQVYETKTQSLYAADAGVEDALYKIVTDNATLPQTVGNNCTYEIPATINDKEVKVEIMLEDEMEHFFEDLLDLTGLKVSPSGHGGWATVTEEMGAGTYNITITYSGAGQTKHIDGLGAWLKGDYEHVEGSDSGMTDVYPPDSFEVKPYEGGTAFIWEWQGTKPAFTSGQTMTQTFNFMPTDLPSFKISWVDTGSADIGIVQSTEIYKMWKITATATDNSTDKKTKITAYASRQKDVYDVYSVSILTWQIS